MTMVRPLCIAIAVCWMATVPARADIVYTFFTDDSQPPDDIYPPATLDGSFTTNTSGNLLEYDFEFRNPFVSIEFSPPTTSATYVNDFFTASFPVDEFGESLTLGIEGGGNLTTPGSQIFSVVNNPPLNFGYGVGYGFGHWEVGTSVPEPSSMALLGSTCLVGVGLAIAARRRRGPKSSMTAMTRYKIGKPL
jgi:PEP-CTERM motif